MERTSQGSVEFYTPAYIVEAVRRTLLAIDLDPASCAAGQSVVQAKRFFTAQDNGLARMDWAGRVFLNPPGGVAEIPELGTRSNQALWYMKLCAHYMARQVSAAIFLCYSIEVLATAQRPCRDAGLLTPLQFPICIPEKRIAFDEPGPDGARVPTNQPKYGNAIVFMPSLSSGEELAAQIGRFREAFADIGDVGTMYDVEAFWREMYERSGQQ